MKYYVKIGVMVAVFISFLCLAESFLVTQKPVRKKTPAHLKQDIIESMGVLLENHAALITLQGQIQLELCRHIKSLAEQDKTSFFKMASVQELQKVLTTVDQANEQCKNELHQHRLLLSSLKSYKSQ